MMPAKSDRCRVCSTPARFVFAKTLRARHRVAYFDCPGCGYLQTETPHWLDEAYASAINVSDTGILARNQANVGRVIMTLLSSGRLDGAVIDQAGGFGILVRLLRDAGVDAYWADKYCENLVARGFEAEASSYDLLTAFEVFEHLLDPVADLRRMLECAPLVLISTQLVTGRATPSPDWWYFGEDHGQHIGFFRRQTLEVMAEKLGCHVRSDRTETHLFSRQPISPLWLALLKRRRWWPAVARLRLRSKTSADLHAQAARVGGNG